MKKILAIIFALAFISHGATYYSSHNASGGGAGTIGDPFTLQELFDNTDSADIGLVMNTGTYTPAATIDVDNPGAVSVNKPVNIRGANADGTDDGTQATISGSALGASTNLITINTTLISIRFTHLRFTSATGSNVVVGVSSTSTNVEFFNCRLDHAGVDGLSYEVSTTSNIYSVIGCTIDSNTVDGVGSSSDARGGGKFLYNKIYDNGGDGNEDDGGLLAPKQLYAFNLIYNNTGYGIRIRYGANNCFVVNNVIYGNSTGGIIVPSNAWIRNYTLINNIIRSNGGYGINTSSGNIASFYGFNNCVSGNTTAAIDINGGVVPGVDNITSDPLFTSEAAGSEDFTLQSGSPCKDQGVNVNGY